MQVTSSDAPSIEGAFTFDQQASTAIQPITGFEMVMSATLKTIAESSQRIYHQTYRLWCDWCESAGIDPLTLTFGNVATFLENQSVSKSTRQRQLSALRKLAEMLAILDYGNPARDAAYKSLKKLKVRHMGDTAGTQRSLHALTPAQADKVLRVWEGSRRIDTRNRALIAVLFMTGMRRSEAIALHWSDVDFENGLLHIRHGKGDKERHAAMAGDFALTALQVWREAAGADRQYVFCSMSKGDKLGADRPTDSQTVYRVVKATEKHSGVVFSPHTVRRTFITEALNNGTPLAEVKAQVGHEQESTTLRYARPVDARLRRDKIRLRYG